MAETLSQELKETSVGSVAGIRGLTGRMFGDDLRCGSITKCGARATPHTFRFDGGHSKE